MREKARAVFDQLLRIVNKLRYRVIYFFNYHKLNKKILKVGVGVFAGLAIFVAIAALLPSHKYKDEVAIGVFSFTNADVSMHESDVKSYYESGGEGVLSDYEDETRSDYELSFDDRFRNIALKQKAQECGVELDDSENSPSFDYDNYSFTLIQEQNRNWEKKLEQCLLTGREILYVMATYDLPTIDEKPQEEADVLYEDAIKRLKELEPMIRNGRSSEEIVEAVENSNNKHGKDPEVGSTLALHAGTHWCAIKDDCFNSDLDLFDDDYPYSKPKNIVSANEEYEKGMKNKGDIIGLITGDNGWFAYYRVEENTGEFRTWEEYYQSMKDKYAYDTIPTAILGTIKKIASPIIGSENAYAWNTMTPYLRVYTDAGANMTTEFYNEAGGTSTLTGYKGHTMTVPTNPYAYIRTDITEASKNKYKFDKLFPRQGNRTQRGRQEGPLNCGYKSKFTEFYIHEQYKSRMISWEFYNPTGMFTVLPKYVRWTDDASNPLLNVRFGYKGGPGPSNGWGSINVGFRLTIMGIEPQPVEDSTPVTRDDGSARADTHATYNTNLADKLHIKEAMFLRAGGELNGRLVDSYFDNYFWPKDDGIFYNPATFNVNLYGPCYTRGEYGDCPELYSDFKNSDPDKYFSFETEQTPIGGWESEKESTLIIGDSVIAQAASALGAVVGSSNVVSITSNMFQTDTAVLTDWFNDSANTAKITDKKYIVIYIGANDLAGNFLNTDDYYDSMIRSLVTAVRSKNSTANLIFISPFNSYNTTNAGTFTPTGLVSVGDDDYVAGYNVYENSADGTLLSSDPWRQMYLYSGSIADEATRRGIDIEIFSWFDYSMASDTMTVTKSGNYNYIDEFGEAAEYECSGKVLLPANDISCSYSVKTNIVTNASGQYKDLTAEGIPVFVNSLVESLNASYPVEVESNISSDLGYGKHGFGSLAANNDNISWITNPGLTPRGEKSVTIQNKTTDPGSDDWVVTAEIDNSSSLPAGIYYFMVNNTNVLNDWQPLNYWYAPYGGAKEENIEQVVKTFKPQVVSNVSSNYFGDGETVSDTIHIREATNSSLWPVDGVDGLGPNSLVDVCVEVYGPFSSPLPSNPSEPYTNIGSKPTMPASEPKQKICKGMNPNINAYEDFVFDGSGGWDSGYYYFYEYIDKENQTVPYMDSLIEESFYPAFNPDGGGYSEWTFRQFQPFVTSNVYNSTRDDFQPWVDVKEDNSMGEDIIDRVVARGSNTQEGAENGFQYGSADDGNGAGNWPRYDSSSGANSGKYLPVLYKFYICGPFQYPQNEGTTSDMKNPTPTNTTNEYQNAYGPQGTACNGDNSLKTIAKYITPNSCSKNPVIKNSDGTWQSPTDNGNVMAEYPGGYIGDGEMTKNNTCEINFGRTDEDGTYYQPGYYYFTSEMLKEEQTTYASGSLNPGLSTDTPIKNFIVSDWQSVFNPLRTQSFWPQNTLDEIEWAYVQPQTIARSYMGATQSADSPYENNLTTRLSYRYTSDRDNKYKGLQLNCNEHNSLPTWTDMINDTDFWDKVLSTKLTCENVSDRVYLGITSTKDVNYSNNVVKDENLDEKHWPKTNDMQSGENGKNYEVIKYQTKLYGPFATASVMTGGTLLPTPDGLNEAGKTITVVPSSSSNNVLDLVKDGAQPVAQSCLLAAKYGPNYNDFSGYDEVNPNNSYNAYYYNLSEKKSIDSNGYYKAIFTRNPEENCASDGSGILGLTDPDNIPYTTLSLTPGVYVSVVETWKVDMNENNIYDSKDTDYGGNNVAEDNFSDNGTKDGGDANADSQTVNSASKRGQIAKGDVRDLIANNFQSRWGDPYETIFVAPNTNVWTLRGNMGNFQVDWGARYHDQYWMTGWSDWRQKFVDIFGNGLPEHNSKDSSYSGEKNYFAPDRDPNERVGKVQVDLYGSFDMRPDTAECPANKKVATWLVDAKDTDKYGDATKLENMLPSSGEGWYVYVFSYEGDDRTVALQTKCSDPDEQFYLGEYEAPELDTQIIVESSEGKAPTVINDHVKLTGYVGKNSQIRLTLFRSGGESHNPNADSLICSVQFTIPSSNELVTYNTSSYVDKNGYVDELNTPVGMDVKTNRCFAEEAGHYYWYEELFDENGKELRPPNADGLNEWVDLEKQPPEVTTNADISVLVGEAFHDTAYVKLPEGDTKTYNLYMRAYGPTAGTVTCDTVGKTNLLFESGPHEVNKSGVYPSSFTTASSPGYVYWIETLVDAETDEIVAEGYCGQVNEMTKINETAAPGGDWEWTAPGAPLAGEIAVSAAKIIITTGLLGVGAWQLLDKNSWLMSKIIR
ncbi:SGNH/GDSL hydrolase family protein [Ruminococcaceae bacterium OttesenSCG-928-A11]|nr:SGNH/GDSL hydrolase family protein [Ruminococcaceae bacterium OttesenSCG-928-A11]